MTWGADLVSKGVRVRKGGLVVLQHALMMVGQQRALLVGSGHFLQGSIDLMPVHIYNLFQLCWTAPCPTQQAAKHYTTLCAKILTCLPSQTAAEPFSILSRASAKV